MAEKNALAELAERLEQIAEVERESAVFHGDPLDASDDIDKAQRIVAELAKVPNISQIPIKHWNCKELEALRNCLAIAEEGAEDGK